MTLYYIVLCTFVSFITYRAAYLRVFGPPKRPHYYFGFFSSNFSFSSKSGFPYGIGLQYITIIVNEYPPLHALHIIMVTRTDKWAWSSVFYTYYYYTFFFSIYYNARECTSTHSRIRYWLIICAYAYAK